jgi:predicted RecA/RadA family phage recombinase
MKTSYQSGDILTLKAPYTVVSGAGALVGSIFGVAVTDVTSGSDGSFAVEGVHLLKKTASQAWTQGTTKVYWDNTAKECTSDATKGPLIGAAAFDAASGAALTTGYVDLSEGVVRTGESQVVVESAPAPTSIATAGNVTLTAAQLLTGVIVRDPAGGARSDTLPTAALLVAAVPGAKVGTVIKTKLINGADAAETITILVGTGGAFDTNQTAAAQVIPQFHTKELVIQLTNVTAAAGAYVAYL